MCTNKSDKLGFTLIELLIVMVILGILTTIAAGNFITTQKKSRDARRKEDIGNVTRVLEAYYNDKGHYPLASVNGEIVACGPTDSTACAWGEPMLDSRGTYYMPQLPVDPSDFSYYYVSEGGSDYQLYARLENSKDRDIATLGSEAAVYENTDCGNYVCNYGVPSTNSTLATIVAEAV